MGQTPPLYLSGGKELGENLILSCKAVPSQQFSAQPSRTTVLSLALRKSSFLFSKRTKKNPLGLQAKVKTLQRSGAVTILDISALLVIYPTFSWGKTIAWQSFRLTCEGGVTLTSHMEIKTFLTELYKAHMTLLSLLICASLKT